MSMSDPIADMLTRIRNANTAKHDTVEIPASKMKKAIADILLSEGYVQAVDIIEDGKFETIKITLKYGADKNEKIITGLKRISKPVYMQARMSFQEYLVDSELQLFQQTKVYLLTRKQESRMLVAKY